MNNSETVALLLRKAFPDPKVTITPEAVTASLRALQDAASRKPELFKGHGFDGKISTDLAPPQTNGDKRIVDYWLGKGFHHRTSPIESKFPVQLSFVRVEVLDGWETSPIETAIGTVHAGDHKLYSLKVAKEYLADISTTLKIEFPELVRVQALTVARAGGARFAAIGVYLFYGATGDPFAYALEAGMATGESRVLYFGADFVKPLLRKSFYKPTPFSDPSFCYRGLFSLNDVGDPAHLSVEVMDNPLASAHMRVEVEYVLVPEKDAPCVFPAILTIQAACRVAAIAEASGMPFNDVGPLAGVFAHLGREMYPWMKKPGARP